MNNFLGSIGGRKFIMAIFGVIAIALHERFGINPDSINTLGGVVAAYILGQGVADGLSHGDTSTTARAMRRD